MRKNRNRLSQAIRAAIALGTVGFGLVAAAPASAQSVTALTREDLQRTGLTSLGDILQHLTVSGATINTGNNSGDGETRVDLRNLGSQRTLVLVNGKRWVSNAATLDGTIDLNTIPLSIVEKVEVLLGGASAIYGSDAIAGVVNIITRTDYEGAEGSAYLGQNQEGDGRVESYDYTIGAKSERASVTANVSYVKQEPILAGDRAISATPIANVPGNVAASSSTPFGRFFRTGVQGSVTFDPTTGGYRPYNVATDGFNIAPDNYLQTPQERTAAYVQARYQLTEAVSFRAEALYNERRSAQQIAAPFFNIGAAFGIPIAIAPGQEFNPFTQVLNRVQFRPDNSYVRRFVQDVDAWHFGAGFDGKFQLLDRVWTWDANYSYAKNEENDTRRNLFNPANLVTALRPDCTAANGCVPVDVFHGPDAFTPEMAATLLFEAHDQFESEQWSYSTNLLTELAELPAGPLSFGAGYEYRREQGFGSADALASSAIAPLLTARGGYALDQLYVEFSAPLLRDAPFAEALTLTGAVGYADYSTFGSTTSPKVGFLWKPTRDLTIRGNWSENFRAPSVSELFLERSSVFGEYVDPCTQERIGGIGEEAMRRCRDGFAGIAPVPPSYIQSVTQTRITVGGNPDLRPERAISRTLGLTYSPHWVQGLDLWLDWYDIEIRDAITQPSPQSLTDACYIAGDVDACHRSGLTRSAGGDISYLFAGNLNVPGGIETEGFDFKARYRIDTGIGQFAWVWDTTYVSYFGELGKPDRLDCPSGRVSTGNTTICPVSVARGNTVGTYDVGDPRWRVRSNLTATWSYADFGATAGLRYYSGLDERCETPVSVGYPQLCSDPDRVVDLDGDGRGDDAPENRIGSRTYVDLQATWDAPWNARFTVGLNNAFDRDPPIAYSAFQNSFDPAYPAPGRFWYAQYTQKF